MAKQTLYRKAAMLLARQTPDKTFGVCSALSAAGDEGEGYDFEILFRPTQQERDELGGGVAYWLAAFRDEFTAMDDLHVRLIALGFADAMAKTGDL